MKFKSLSSVIGDDILLEAFISGKSLDKFISKYRNKFRHKDIISINFIDPTSSDTNAVKYTEWLLKVLHNSDIRDLSSIRDMIVRHDKIRDNLSRKDIYSFKSLEEFKDYYEEEVKDYATSREVRRDSKKDVNIIYKMKYLLENGWKPSDEIIEYAYYNNRDFSRSLDRYS